jgi:hypothetical protein
MGLNPNGMALKDCVHLKSRQGSKSYLYHELNLVHLHFFTSSLLHRGIHVPSSDLPLSNPRSIIFCPFRSNLCPSPPPRRM